MRIALLSISALILVAAAGLGQDAKKGDAKPDDKGKDAPEIKEIAGKSFEQWIKEIHSADPSKRENAIRSVSGFGDKKAQAAVPAILAELKKHNKAAPVDLTVRTAGAVALGTILSSVTDPDQAQVKEAITILRRFTRDEEVLVRARSAQALGQLAKVSVDVQDAIDDVIRVAKDPQTWQARKAGLEALSSLAIIRSIIEKKSPPSKVLYTLENALNDNAMLVRITAIQCLAQLQNLDYGDDVRRTHALEARLAKDPDPSVHIWCELALITVKKNLDSDHLAGIIKMLHYQADPNIRIQAANSLGMIAQQPPHGTKDPMSKLRALNGAERKLVVKELTAALTDPDIGVVSACIGALFMVEPDDAIDPIARLLNHETPIRRAQGAQALGMLGEKAKPVENLLIVKLSDKNLDVVAHVITALVQMRSVNAIPALERLMTMIPDDDKLEHKVIKKAAKEAIRVILEEDSEKKDKKGKAPAKTVN